MHGRNQVPACFRNIVLVLIRCSGVPWIFFKHLFQSQWIVMKSIMGTQRAREIFRSNTIRVQTLSDLLRCIETILPNFASDCQKIAKFYIFFCIQESPRKLDRIY